MTPQEKAKELYDKFTDYAYVAWNGGKDELTTEIASRECALIAVEEMINMAKVYDNHNVKTDKHIYTLNVVLYWQEVKNEIEKL